MMARGLGPSPAVSDRLRSKFKENGNQIVVEHLVGMVDPVVS